MQHKSRAANQAPLSKILQAYHDSTVQGSTVQREVMDDEELLQGKFETAQRKAFPEEEEEPLQGKFDVAQRESISKEDEESLQQKTENRTGLPDDLKAGVEAASGFSMDDVRVHYNSAKPAQLQALAYTQGTEIHVGPGQEKHLPHEAWHVVQQKQGRVKPTVQMQRVQVNDEERLEKEAENMQIKDTNEISISKKKVNLNEKLMQFQPLVLPPLHRQADVLGYYYNTFIEWFNNINIEYPHLQSTVDDLSTDLVNYIDNGQLTWNILESVILELNAKMEITEMPHFHGRLVSPIVNSFLSGHPNSLSLDIPNVARTLVDNGHEDNLGHFVSQALAHVHGNLPTYEGRHVYHDTDGGRNITLFLIKIDDIPILIAKGRHPIPNDNTQYRLTWTCGGNAIWVNDAYLGTGNRGPQLHPL